MKKLRLSILIAVCSLLLRAEAQTDCRESLYEANKKYEAGDLQGCISTLESCLAEKEKRRFANREELTESYRLLALAYQNLNDAVNAEKYVRKMLLNKPDYQKFPNIDPIDFSRLVARYSVDPKFSLGVFAGFNMSSAVLKKSYSAYSSAQRYLPAAGYEFGIHADRALRPMFSVVADLQACGTGIRHEIDDAGGFRQTYREQQSLFLLTAGVSRQIKIGGEYRLHGRAGAGISHLSSGNVFFEAENLESGFRSQATQDPLPYRNRNMALYYLGGGISMPLSGGRIGLECTFRQFLANTVNGDKRMDDLNFILNNQYINDDIRLRTVAVRLMVLFPLTWEVRQKK